jgi:hypothetical protein
MLVRVAEAGDIEAVRAPQTRGTLAEGNRFVSIVSFCRAGPFDVTSDGRSTAPAPGFVRSLFCSRRGGPPHVLDSK